MEELFRFVSVRPPEAVDEEEASPDVIRLDTGSDFQERLRRSETQAERTRVARDFEGDERFVADAGELPPAPGLRAVQARYEDADPGGLQASDVVAGVAANLDLGDQNPRPKLRKLVGSNDRFQRMGLNRRAPAGHDSGDPRCTATAPLRRRHARASAARHASRRVGGRDGRRR